MPFNLSRSVRAFAVCVAVVSTAAAVQPGVAAADAAGPPDTAEPAEVGRGPVVESHDVTLVTGDVARLTVHADGTERATLTARTRRSSGFHAFNRGGDAYLVPSAAAPLLARDELDLRLFNISALVEQGLADAESGVLPLILTYEQPRGRRSGPQPVDTPDGSTRDHLLESLGALAVTQQKATAHTFWRDVTSAAEGPAPGLRTADPIDKIWLDAQVHATLDESAAAIGAPAAWTRGLTGDGVRVATLDTGIDTGHPDFADRVVATADFTGGSSVRDADGHGTHVASIAAGSGAASGGRYRGISPDATLLVGKVLGDEGTGTMSDVIEGMEWAAAHGADIVNLSLGGPVTRGEDPMSKAVDRLTSQQDVLFVVAAGNYSPWAPGMAFVTSPAAADSALAVGALRRPDSLWGGSRRGRMGGDAIKPEITAPGFAITAAGASGAGLPPYTTKTGTSMAAPHVTGAAAVLKQQHPGWGPEQLRAALTSTAAPIADFFHVYERGAGRVDVDRATAQQVFVDAGVLHLGYLARPFDPAELRVTRTLRYRNGSGSPVTLDLATTLASEGTTAPAGALTVQPTTLTLAPGESRSATVRLDATELPAGTYSGAVTAVTAVSGKTRVRTTVGFYKQDDTVDVTLRAVDRDGQPATATIRITPYQELDGRYFPDYVYLSPQQPEHTLRLPEGDYSVWSLITTFDASGRFAQQDSIVGDPKLEVRAPNFEVTLDARDAVPVSLDTPRPSQPRSMTMSWWRGEPGTTLYGEETWAWSFNDGEPEQVFITPTERVDDAPFGVATSFDAGVPALTGRAGGVDLDIVQVAGQLVDGRRRLPLVDAGTASSDDLAGTDLRGAAALVQESAERSPSEQVEALADAGAEMVVLYSAHPGVFWPSRVAGPVPVLTLPMRQGEALTDRLDRHPVDLHLTGAPRTPYAYDVSFAERGRVPAEMAYRVRPADLATVETTIFSTGTGERGWRLHQSAFTDCDCGSPAVDDFVPATGYTRTEYVTAGSDLTSVSAWQFLFGRPADILYSREERSYAAGDKVEEHWLQAPLSPGVPQSDIRAGGRNPVSRRTGDRIYYSLAALTDSAGHWTPSFSSANASSRLYRDGEEIYDNSRALWGSVTVPADEATYRLEADVDHDGARIGLSTRTRTAWTFRSGGTGAETVLPLIDIDYRHVVGATSGRPALDLHNTGKPRQRVRLEMVASHQHGSTAPPVQDLDVQVSYDDGATWRPAQVSSDGDTFSAEYRHPSVTGHDGYVSLRVHAYDGAGGELEQTLIRAYRLRG